MHSIRTDADVAKALALDADAVAIGQGVLMALGCGRDTYQQAGKIHSAEADYAVLENRLEPDVGAKHVTNYLKTLTLELATLARACGTQDVHHLEPEDLVALTVEAAGRHAVDSRSKLNDLLCMCKPPGEGDLLHPDGSLLRTQVSERSL